MYFISQGERIIAYTVASSASKMRAVATVRYFNGTYGTLTISEFTPSASRAVQEWISPDVAPANGEVIGLAVFLPNDTDITFPTVQRGQILCKVVVGTNAQSPVIAQGYVYDFGALTLGQHDDPGPAGGSGWTRIRLLKSDAAAAANTTIALATTYTIQKFHSIGYRYACSAAVAARTVYFALFNQGTSQLPTGYGTGGQERATWTPGGSIALTASQSGLFYVDATRTVRNTNGTLATESMASAPSPLPLIVVSNDLSFLYTTVTGNDASDAENIVALVEEWIIF